MLQKLKSLFAKAHNWLPPSLREVLSEDGVGSYSRFSGFFIIVATVCWVTFLVIKNHAFPDMTGATAFIAGGQAQYVANQAKRVVAAAKNGTVSPMTNGGTDVIQP